MKRPTGDDDCSYIEDDLGSVGAVSTWSPRNPDDSLPIRREFWIGFHCAAPGPSHEPPPRPKRTRRKTA